MSENNFDDFSVKGFPLRLRKASEQSEVDRIKDFNLFGAISESHINLDNDFQPAFLYMTEKYNELQSIMTRSLVERRNKLFNAILYQLLKREPTIEDYKKVTLASLPIDSFGPEKKEMYFEGVHLGTITDGFNANFDIQPGNKIELNYILKFDPSPTFKK